MSESDAQKSFMRVQKTNALTRKKAPKEKQSKKMRRENIIRIIPKRFQCGLRVFHSILDCNHSLASFATVLFLWFCDAARDAHTQCEAAFAFLHDTRAAISLWTAHWTLSVRVFSSACILYSLKSFFFLAFVFHFFCCCCCRFALHDFLDLLLYLSVVSSFPLPFRCVCVCICAFQLHSESVRLPPAPIPSVCWHASI